MDIKQLAHPVPPPHVPDPQTGPVVEVRNLSKHYHRGRHETVRALDDVSLEFRPGEFVVLLGPSGCGKTSLLRCIAGLERPDGGSIHLRSAVVFSADDGIEVPPERRDLSMMFQTYALWPNMTVAQNVRYPLESRPRRDDAPSSTGRSGGRMSRSEMDERVRAALTLVGIPELVDRYPNQLSGGQQQRVAVARALVRRSDVVLFDEPLSNVDAKVREELRRELSEMQRRLGFAAIYVTHDQAEAMQLGDRVVVMRAGRVEQEDPPEDVYLRPRTRFVANFVGASNEVAGELDLAGPTQHADHEHAVVQTAIGPIHGSLAGDQQLADRTEVVASWRPEAMLVYQDEPAGPNTWRMEITNQFFMGTYVECIIRVGDRSLRLFLPRNSGYRSSLRDGWVTIDPDDVSILAT